MALFMRATDGRFNTLVLKTVCRIETPGALLKNATFNKPTMAGPHEAGHDVHVGICLGRTAEPPA
jgi:hypothetical protein